MLFDRAPFVDPVDDAHYRQIDISEEHNQYIPFLSKQNMTRIGLYMSSDYELDVTSNAFTEDYKKYVDEQTIAENQRKEDALKELRSQRNTLIDTTDKYVMPDFPMDDEKRKKWLDYRQRLRDLPAMSSPDLDEDGNLTGVEWPDAPS
jgi:hypothetical protein